MDERVKNLTEEFKEMKIDIKNFPDLLDTKLALHSNGIKLYLDNTIESHLRDTGKKMFASRYIQTWAVPILFTSVGALAVWLFQLALQK